MSLYDILDQVVALLKNRGRVTYRALKREFNLDDDFIDDLKEELLFSSHPVSDEDGRGFVWNDKVVGTSEQASQPDQPKPQPVVQQSELGQGTSSSIEPQTPDAERRQLTVMFCDLVGSTELSGQMDAEDYRELVRAYQTTCGDVIERFDCHIAQTLGDGLLIYSGYPIARENDAERAVRVGLGILDAMKALNQRLEQEQDIRLAVRIGIHTGPVVVGAVGAGTSQEQLALGEVPNVAARIQGLATPDTVVISADTYQLIRGYFDCETLGERDLRGVAEPVVVYQVLRESGVQNRLDVASTRGLTPLIGRESESTLLFERWAQAKNGNGQVVLLSGEAGIGKSRLVQALKDHIADEPHTRLECRSSPYFTNSALYPIIDMVQRTLRFQADDTPETKLEKLEQNLSQYQLPLEESIPLFGTLLSLPVPEDRYLPLDLTPQRQRQKTLEAIIAIILELAEQRPVLFIMEDGHWWDPSTNELLDLLIELVPTSQILTLITYRPEFQHTWGNRSYHTPITLNRLSSDGIEQIANKVAGEKSLPGEVLQQLVEKTDGVPLYVEEMTKSVLESGLLKESDEQYELTGSITSLSIPSTLQDSLMSRLDRLMTAKVIAQLGATIGRQFEYELLCAVAQLDELMLQRELGRLVDAELVYQRGLPPDATYTFKHALVQDTAYESLLRSTRQGYHHRIAAVLEERFPETVETQPELLAYHSTEAGLNEQAIGYWQQASEHAFQNSNYIETLAHLTKGLEILPTLSDTDGRAQYELRMQITRGLVLTHTKGHASTEAGDAYTRARELCQQVGDRQQLASILAGLRRFYLTRGEYRTARDVGKDLLHFAQEQDDVIILLWGHFGIGAPLFALAEFSDARKHLEQGVSLYNPGFHQTLIARYGADLGVICRSWGALSLWHLGYPIQALQQSQEAIRLAQDLSHPFSLALGLSFGLHLHQLCGDVNWVLEQAEFLVSLAGVHNQDFRFQANIFRNWGLALQGHGEQSIGQMRNVLKARIERETRANFSYYLSLLAQAYGQIDDFQQGIQLLTEALTNAQKTGEKHHEAEIHHLKGQLLLQQSPANATESESCFHQAISISQNQSAKSWELRAATSLAKLWQSQGKREEARELLEPVYSWFTEGFDTADLIDAKTLLDELS